MTISGGVGCDAETCEGIAKLGKAARWKGAEMDRAAIAKHDQNCKGKARNCVSMYGSGPARQGSELRRHGLAKMRTARAAHRMEQHSIGIDWHRRDRSAKAW